MTIKKTLTSLITATFLLVSAISAEPPRGEKSSGSTKGRLARSIDPEGPSSTFFNINSWKIQMENQGFFAWNGTSHGSAGNYPIGMGSVIFAEGILWGARVSDEYGVDATGALLTDGTGGGTPKIRVNGSMYNTGLKAGKVLRDANGRVLSSDYSEDYRDQQVWRVRKNWNTADLTNDIAIIKNIEPSEVTPAMVTAGADQYKADWTNWPADEGAPFDDVDGDGVYTPGTWDAATSKWVGDVPGIPGADQTVWTVANDLPDEYTESGIPVSVSEGGWGSPPIGIELQITLWGYDFPFSNPISSMMFKRARVNYVGLPGGPADAKLDTVYFTQWSDPDLGTYTDDYVGSDTTLSLGYVYNGNRFDDQFLSSYGSAVPSAGYDFLEGPKVDVDGDGVMDTLGMTSFVYFAAGSSISDPSTKVYTGTLQWFNLMEGFLPRPEYPTQLPFVDPITGANEKYVLAGDPTQGTGWIDGIILPPGDRRLVMNTGPFSMAIGDTQDVVIGLIGGMGEDNLSSVTVMKYNDSYAQYAYDQNFVLPVPPSSPKVSAFEGDGYLTLSWDTDWKLIEQSVIEGFEFEGYKVYQLPNALANPDEGVLVATYDIENLVKTISGKRVDLKSGLLLTVPEHYGTDSGVMREIKISEDYLRSRPMTNDRPYYYGVSAYSYNKVLAADPTAPFKALESPMTRVTVVPKTPDPGVSFASETGDVLDVTHNGTANATATVSVTSPAQLTGSDYQVYFDNQHYYRDVDGVWKETAFPDSVGKVLAKGSLDCSGSTVTASALASATVGSADLTFTFDMDCGSNWVDGLVLDLPDDLEVNSWGTPVTGTGGNLLNSAGTLDATTNTITWGNDIQSEYGGITGDVVWVVNTSIPTFPMSVSYIVHDDNYDGTKLDASGTATVAELGYEFKTIKHWNLKNATTGAVLIDDQYILGGSEVDHVDFNGKFVPGGTVRSSYMPSSEGIKLAVNGGYAAPKDAESRGMTKGSGVYDVKSYFYHGWASTAKATSVVGYGVTTVDTLQRDIKVVFDGVYLDTIKTGDINYVPVDTNTGSWVYYRGSRGGSVAAHPSPYNPGTGDPFKVRVPFKVYDMEPEGGGDPVQISMQIYDRIQTSGTGDYAGTYDGAGDGNFAYFAFNPYSRMYTEFIHRPYAETLADYDSNKPFATWNVVWWSSQHVIGDEVTFVYANPIQIGGDNFTFSTTKATTTAVVADDLKKINVFPNPYMGYHDLEGTDSVLPLPKYITFNHLPVSGKVTFRVFNLAGTMVHSFDKSTTTQYQQWDMRNADNFPLASGVYIVHIDVDGIGEKILKLAIVQEDEFAKRF